ncbi:PAS domain S-box protein, partial [Candidatus Parcubacteria bacterium]|nr:PAS domain S-box protein [Candidatus Parcubacteria bacterium]
KIEEEKNKTRAALVSLSDGLIVFDKEQRITLVNPEAERILEIKENKILNKRIDEIADAPNLNALYKALGQKIKWTEQKYKLVLEEPIKKFFQVSIVKVAVEKAEVGLMVILHDVTRDKEIDRMKTEFISIAAHQLRTPLSAVKWALQMILNGHMGKIDPEVKEYLKKSYQSNERMISLVNDLLNISRIEEGRFLYDLKLVSIKDVIKEAIFSLKVLLSKRKIKVKFNAAKKKMPKIKADAKKIKLAIQNLIDNATRYSIAGNEVIINLKQIKEKKNNFIKIEIKDYGIGINIKDQERLFSKFFRGNNAVRFQTEGSGLGLFIVKNIIEAHHGKIWFKSEKNKGTTFYIKLPIT